MTYNEKIKQEVLKIYDYVKREEVSMRDALCLICDLAEDVYCDVMEPYFDEPEEEYSVLIGSLCDHYEIFHSAKSYLYDLDEDDEPYNEKVYEAELRKWVRVARKA